MIKPPTAVTLKKYGITAEEWLELAAKQGNKCAVCGALFDGSRRANVDHFHVQGYKKFPPEERRKYIRGILCFTCNYLLLMRGVTIERLQSAIIYLKSFQERKPK